MSTIMKHQYHPREIWIRAQQVGGLSLSALLVGGTLLNFFSVNIWVSRETYHHDSTDKNSAVTLSVFRVGSQLGIQFWLAVLGVAFGLLSYGMNASYIHLFDCWSSYRANRSPGLNYARYLNSQPHSPVLFGVRGFPGAILIRNVIIALGMICSVGYNFAVVEVTVNTYQPLDASRVRLIVPPISGLLAGGIASPWLGDGPSLRTNRAFVHQFQHPHHIYNASTRAGYNPNLPLKRVIMAGWADCGDIFNLLDEGVLYTREIVMVASRTEDDTGPSNDRTMMADSLDWLRIANASSKWTTTGAPVQAVIDYRVSQPSQVDIQWAEMGSWLQDSSKQQPIIQRVSYTFHLAVAIVRRFVSGRDCSGIYNMDGGLLAARIIVESRIPVTTDNYPQGISVPRNWVIPIMLDENAGPLEGVSGVLRSLMALWGPEQRTELNRTLLGHAPADPPDPPRSIRSTRSQSVTGAATEPLLFNEQEYAESARINISSPMFYRPTALNNNATQDVRAQDSPSSYYPAYAGTRVTGQTGSYHNVMYLFIGIGTFAYVVVGIRMYLGPAELTSWIGQHVYLAGLGGKVPREATEHLARGHRAARESQLGMLRVKANEPLTRREFMATSVAERIYREDPLNASIYIGRMVNGF